MPSRDLEERDPAVATDPIGRVHEEATDPPLTDPRVDHEREHAQDTIAVLEARNEVGGHEAHDIAAGKRNDDGPVTTGEPVEPLNNLPGPGGIALISKQLRDPLCVSRDRGPDRDIR